MNTSIRLRGLETFAGFGEGGSMQVKDVEETGQQKRLGMEHGE